MYTHFLSIDFVKVYCIIIPIYNECLYKKYIFFVTVANKRKIICYHESQKTHKFHQNQVFLLPKSSSWSFHSPAYFSAMKRILDSVWDAYDVLSFLVLRGFNWSYTREQRKAASFSSVLVGFIAASSPTSKMLLGSFVVAAPRRLVGPASSEFSP